MIFQKKSPKDKEWELLLKQEDKMLRKRENANIPKNDDYDIFLIHDISINRWRKLA